MLQKYFLKRVLQNETNYRCRNVKYNETIYSGVFSFIGKLMNIPPTFHEDIVHSIQCSGNVCN